MILAPVVNDIVDLSLSHVVHVTLLLPINFSPFFTSVSCVLLFKIRCLGKSSEGTCSFQKLREGLTYFMIS